jgi:hypothetical protein
MIERGIMLKDNKGQGIFYPDPDGDWWRWGKHNFRKKEGFDWLYWIALRIDRIKK